MLLKKIKLKNIRSYKEQEIKFPTGITLLSGNVGSGKSTILLAIDFVLFGIRRGELSGSTLLRNGAESGYVILTLQIKDKEINIKRVLKRSTTGITQDSGFLSINDITQELTPVELKQRILEILNYPQESATKKSAIYKYTVYTPQEEMRIILSGEKEIRQETLRKVFNIDKYKRITENTKILISELRSRKKEIQGQISDLEQKKLKQKELEQRIIEIKLVLIKIYEQLTNINTAVTNKKTAILSIELEIKKLNSIKNYLEVITSELKIKTGTKTRLLTYIEEIKKQILNTEIKPEIEQELETIKKEIQKNIDFTIIKEKELKEVIRKTSELKIKKQSSEQTKNKITTLDNCPLCEQSVTHDHKTKVIQREDETINKITEELNSYTQLEIKIEKEIHQIKQETENQIKKQRELDITKIKQNEIKQKHEQLNRIQQETEQIEEELKILDNKRTQIELDINKLKDVETAHIKEKTELDMATNEQKNLEIEKATQETEQKLIEIQQQDITKEIETKIKAKTKLENYSNLQEWLEEFFINLMQLMERKIMLKIHAEFSALFQNWFSMLMDTEAIKVRLDEEFTPIIEQSGYDMEYENLSGGEKTACALAYRLALNQVINTIADYVNTKDLIILDEPTEGFSSEQIERMRTILEELKMNQIIIVSHESKIESFVDNIIKIEKEAHESIVTQ